MVGLLPLRVILLQLVYSVVTGTSKGRINPHTRANYLASPLLCIAYALAGTVNIDFDTEPLGKGLLIIRTLCNIVISRY